MFVIIDLGIGDRVFVMDVIRRMMDVLGLQAELGLQGFLQGAVFYVLQGVAFADVVILLSNVLHIPKK